MLAGFKKTIQVLNVCVLLNGFKIRRNDVIIIRFMNEFFNSINYKWGWEIRDPLNINNEKIDIFFKNKYLISDK
jgi:hypothetical protein